jgi:exopolysaccharide biosynthesis polyprenyl glycosylphosphotransferase
MTTVPVEEGIKEGGAAIGDAALRPVPGPVATLSTEPSPRHRPRARRPGTRPPFPVGTALLVSDVACPLIVFFIVASVASWRASNGPNWKLHLLFVAVSWTSFLVASLALRLPGTLRRHLVPTATQDLGRSVAAVIFGAGCVLAADTLLRSAFEPVIRPRYVILGTAACILALPAARVITLAQCSRRAWARSRIVVVGTGVIAWDVAARLSRSPVVELAGYVDDDPVDGQTVLGPIRELPTICEAVAADRVVVAFSPSHPCAIVDSLRRLPGSVAVDVVPRYYDLTGWQAHLGDLDGLTVVNLADPPGTVGRATKRLLDLVGAGSILLLTAPLLGLAALAVKATSSGPVLFRQPRLGRERRVFQVLKMRTMYVQPAPGSGLSRPVDGAAVDGDERVTSVGRILRRTGIDELPQLVNVLVGQMSLVGPRPFVPDECEDLPDWAEHRFDVRPGLTGLWQVCGQHALRRDELYRLDAQYVASPSLSCDLRILARTPRRLLRGGGDRDAFRRPGEATVRYRSDR